MDENKIGTISINQLFGKKFYIPSYQRGYRWEKQQVEDLLNDIKEFETKVSNKNVELGEFYCLQPLIVKKSGELWEVVDGQQRLTTMYIILSFLAKKGDYGIPENLFSIQYETREKDNKSSKLFLENITSTTEIDKSNIDFYRMSDAFLTIKEWFEKNKPKVLGKYIDALISYEPDDNDIDNANNLRFIWYPLNVINQFNEKSNIIFTKYNQGKIELTNAELIKAILYLSKNENEKKKRQIKIGYEWDNIETSLRIPEFWRFINPSKNYYNHIEIIFDLVASKYREHVAFEVKKDDRLRAFYIFSYLINNKIKIYDVKKYDNTSDFLWDEVKTYFNTFMEWYNSKDESNRYIYFHLIGFLLQIEGNSNNIDEIIKLAKENTKSDFINVLIDKIKNYFGEIDFNEIGYDENKEKAKNILLLFNVISTMNSGFIKFSFDRISSWSLEHIHAQQSEEITREKDKRLLLTEQFVDPFIIKDEHLKNKIENLLSKSEINQNSFSEIQNKIFKMYSDTDVTIHSIKNLALLTPSDNSSLNNAAFYKKRNKIKELDENGSFIPICTKNVFMKYYSNNTDQNFKWDKKDMESYLLEIKKTLKDYIKIKDI